jgi:hypothetical protein
VTATPDEQRPGHGRDGEAGAHEALVLGALTSGHDVGDDRLRQDHQAAATEALHGPAGDEHRHAVGEAADHGAEHEHADRGDEDGLAPDEVADLAVHRHHHGRDDQVDDQVDRVARSGEVELRLHGGGVELAGLQPQDRGVLAREVVEERPWRDVCALGDQLDGGAVEAELGHQVDRGALDARPRLGPFAVALWGRRVVHGGTLGQSAALQCCIDEMPMPCHRRRPASSIPRIRASGGDVLAVWRGEC